LRCFSLSVPELLASLARTSRSCLDPKCGDARKCLVLRTNEAVNIGFLMRAYIYFFFMRAYFYGFLMRAYTFAGPVVNAVRDMGLLAITAGRILLSACAGVKNVSVPAKSYPVQGTK